MLYVPVNFIGQSTAPQVPDVGRQPRRRPLCRVQLVDGLLLAVLHRWSEGGSVLPDPSLEISCAPRVKPAGFPFEADHLPRRGIDWNHLCPIADVLGVAMTGPFPTLSSWPLRLPAGPLDAEPWSDHLPSCVTQDPVVVALDVVAHILATP